MTIANTIALIRQGIDYALVDYCRLAEKPLGVDVKPKEDQLKCALYRAFTEAGHVVHVEGGYERGGAECDLMVSMRRPVGIEIKTAWAAASADGWKNKPGYQTSTWSEDIRKLRTLAERGFGSGFFVMLFSYQAETVGEKTLRGRMSGLGRPVICTEPRGLTLWNGLDTLECYAWRVF